MLCVVGCSMLCGNNFFKIDRRKGRLHLREESNNKQHPCTLHSTSHGRSARFLRRIFSPTNATHYWPPQMRLSAQVIYLTAFPSSYICISGGWGTLDQHRKWSTPALLPHRSSTFLACGVAVYSGCALYMPNSDLGSTASSVSFFSAVLIFYIPPHVPLLLSVRCRRAAAPVEPMLDSLCARATICSHDRPVSLLCMVICAQCTRSFVIIVRGRPVLGALFCRFYFTM